MTLRHRAAIIGSANPIELAEVCFAVRGAGGAFWEDGRAAIGGRLPVNTHGGMLSHAHTGAAGGVFGLIEASLSCAVV